MKITKLQSVYTSPRLETPRLQLYQLTRQDATDCANLGWEDRDGNPIITEDAAKAYLERLLSDKNAYFLGIHLKSDQTLIGHLELCHFDWYTDKDGVHTAEICYGLSKTHWRAGYATEAAGALIDYVFREVALHKITADTDPANVASQKVLTKLGFTLEGVAREKYFDKKERKWTDEMNWGLLRREWMNTHEESIYKNLENQI